MLTSQKRRRGHAHRDGVGKEGGQSHEGRGFPSLSWELRLRKKGIICWSVLGRMKSVPLTWEDVTGRFRGEEPLGIKNPQVHDKVLCTTVVAKINGKVNMRRLDDWTL